MNETIKIEPFVYTSMDSHFSKGYQLVIRGHETFNNSSDFAELEDVLSKMKRISEHPTRVDAILSIGSYRLRVAAIPIESDWKGRQGAHCSALAYYAADIRKTKKGTILAADSDSLPFISLEEAVKLDQQYGADCSGAIDLVDLGDLDVSAAILRERDHTWCSKNHSAVASALESMSSGASLDIVDCDDPEAFLRWIIALMPSRQRSRISCIMNAKVKLDIPVDIFFRGLSQDKQVSSNDVVDVITPESRPESSLFRHIEEIIESASKSQIAIDKDVQAFSSNFNQKEISEEFWQLFSQNAKAMKMLEVSNPIKEDPAEFAKALSHLWVMNRSTFEQYTGQYSGDWYIAGLQWLSGMMSHIASFSPEASEMLVRNISISLAERSDAPDLQSVVDNTSGSSELHSLPFEYTQQLIASGKMSADADLVDTVCSMREEERRIEWLRTIAVDNSLILVQSKAFRKLFASIARHLSDTSRRSILKAGISVGDDKISSWALKETALVDQLTPADFSNGVVRPNANAASHLINTLRPDIEKSYEWWRLWPDNDNEGRDVWEKYISNNFQALSVDCMQAVIANHLQRQAVEPKMLLHYITCICNRADRRSIDSVLSLIDNISHRVDVKDTTVIKKVISGIRENSDISKALNKELNRRESVRRKLLERDLDSYPFTPRIMMNSAIIICLIALISCSGYFAIRYKQYKDDFAVKISSFTQLNKPVKSVEGLDGWQKIVDEDPAFAVKQYKEALSSRDLNIDISMLWDQLAQGWFITKPSNEKVVELLYEYTRPEEEKDATILSDYIDFLHRLQSVIMVGKSNGHLSIKGEVDAQAMYTVIPDPDGDYKKNIARLVYADDLAVEWSDMKTLPQFYSFWMDDFRRNEYKAAKGRYLAILAKSKGGIEYNRAEKYRKKQLDEAETLAALASRKDDMGSREEGKRLYIEACADLEQVFADADVVYNEEQKVYLANVNKYDEAKSKWASSKSKLSPAARTNLILHANSEYVKASEHEYNAVKLRESDPVKGVKEYEAACTALAKALAVAESAIEKWEENSLAKDIKALESRIKKSAIKKNNEGLYKRFDDNLDAAKDERKYPDRAVRRKIFTGVTAEFENWKGAYEEALAKKQLEAADINAAGKTTNRPEAPVKHEAPPKSDGSIAGENGGEKYSNEPDEPDNEEYSIFSVHTGSVKFNGKLTNVFVRVDVYFRWSDGETDHYELNGDKHWNKSVTLEPKQIEKASERPPDDVCSINLTVNWNVGAGQVKRNWEIAEKYTAKQLSSEGLIKGKCKITYEPELKQNGSHPVKIEIKTK